MTGSATYRATDGGLGFDAFYRNEWGVKNDATNSVTDASDRAGWHKNVFTTVSGSGTTLAEKPQAHKFSFKNKADLTRNPGLRDKSNPVPSGQPEDFEATAFYSDSVQTYAAGLGTNPWTTPLNITLFFGVEWEYNRHGIRSFFKPLTGMQTFVEIPGMETPRFAVSIDDPQLKTALKTHFAKPSVPYEIKVLAGFSTGSCGLNQAILNELVDLSKVERVIFYDCLYSQQTGNTANALRLLKAKASNKLKIVVYKTSECGNSYKDLPVPCLETMKTKCGKSDPKCLDFNRISVAVDNPGLIDSQGIISNLFQNTSYISLVIFRALESAVDDGVITLSATNKPPYDDMAALLSASPRGTMISNQAAYKFIRGSVPISGVTLFEDWATKNASTIRAFRSKVGLVSAKDSYRNLLWKNRLPGWPGGDGEEKHDLLIPEFGWEYLPY